MPFCGQDCDEEEGVCNVSKLTERAIGIASDGLVLVITHGLHCNFNYSRLQYRYLILGKLNLIPHNVSNV